MAAKSTQVDWQEYARKYDMLLAYNPFYQQLQQEVLQLVDQWEIGSGELIADLGAGTGNYSLALARRFPGARVLHIDNNPAMNELARQKKVSQQLEGLEIWEQGIEEVELEENSLQGLLSVHALYAFPHPQDALKKAYRWLRPGGKGVLVDPGRVVNVRRWQLAIGWHLLRSYGPARTLRIMQDGKIVSRQNRYIRSMQKRGELWTHSHEEFCDAVMQAGFRILESRLCFRGLSDLVVVCKS